MNPQDHRRSAAQRTLPFRTRGDLVVVETAFAGQTSYVVKDPIANESFHLSAEEHRLLDALRHPASLKHLARILETESAPRRATPAQLQQFVNQLYAQGLVISENPGQGAELAARGHREKRRRRWIALPQLLSIRLAGFDAGPLVDKLYRPLRFAFSLLPFIAALALVAYALLLVIGNAPAIAARLPALNELARPALLPAWIVAIAGVKILHELGHALTCCHYGARPQEMGVLLLAGAPALYCDVSDAWRLPSKWQRMAVSGAGMFVELVIAAAAAIVWFWAQPGLLAALCLSLIIVCSVGTLLVNLNPLLRYDGYYLLADWLEVPNLADRARGLLAGAARRWLLAEPPAADPLLNPRKRRALWVYAILSKIYLAFVLLAIFVVFLKLARPYDLQNVVYTAATIVVAGLALRPIIALSRLMMNPSIRARLRWFRFSATLALFASLLVALFMFPITRQIKARAVVVPAHSLPLFAVAAGHVEFALPVGAEVKQGDVVLRLHNPELALAVATKQGEVRERRVRVEQLQTLQAVTPEASRSLPAARAELADAEAQLAEEQAMAEMLIIRASAAGRVWRAPPQSADQNAPDTLATWSGSPLDPQNLGAWIESGTPLAVIAGPGGLSAWAGVEQADAPEVEVGQSVRLLADQRPMEILTGRVTHVSRTARPNDRDDAGRDAHQSELFGDTRYHVAEIHLDAPDAALLPGARGTAKIAAHRTTLGGLLLLHLRRTFRQVF
jgi:putative peptide zinc metalloprotease protein